MRKKLLLDARMVGPQGHGISTYVLNIARCLKHWRNSSIGVRFLVDGRYHTQDLEKWSEGALHAANTLPCKAPFLSPRAQFEIPRLLRAERFDAYHSTSFDSLFVCPVPYVCTVHDLIHLGFGSLSQRLYYFAVLEPFLAGSCGVTTVSEWSKTQMIAKWGGRLPEVCVIPNAYSGPQGVSSGDFPSTRPFLLCLTNSKPHKNAPFLVQAFGRSQLGARGWQLQISLPLRKIEMESGTQPQGVVAWERGSRSAGEWMQAAQAVVIPSLEEGFGLSLLEAASVGARVLVSDIPPHREIAKLGQMEGVTWLDPRDLESWVKAFNGLKLREPQQAASRVGRPEAFSLEKKAERLFQFYSDCFQWEVRAGRGPLGG